MEKCENKHKNNFYEPSRGEEEVEINLSYPESCVVGKNRQFALILLVNLPLYLKHPMPASFSKFQTVNSAVFKHMIPKAQNYLQLKANPVIVGEYCLFSSSQAFYFRLR